MANFNSLINHSCCSGTRFRLSALLPLLSWLAENGRIQHQAQPGQSRLRLFLLYLKHFNLGGI